MRSITQLANIVLVGLAITASGCSSSTKDETPLGTASAGAYTFTIHQEKAMVAPGALTRFVLQTSNGKPDSVTGWVGVMSGEGSTKVPANYDSGDLDWDDDVTSPATIPAGSKFWFEVVTAGKTDVGSIDFKM
ncbi:MAG: hypothetical protein ABIP39_10950 [Polyangiaceae bacterium]